MQQLQQQRQACLTALARLAGVQDERGLAQLQELQAQVGSDAGMITLDAISRELPRLRVLRLDSSCLPYPQPFAGLSGGLCTSLAVLAVNACCLRSLEGLGLLHQLRELYAAANQVDDLAPLAGLAALQLLDLQDNVVSDADMLLYLAGCSRLASVQLRGNPISTSSGYAAQVRQHLPAVEYLDGRHMCSCTDSSSCCSSCLAASVAEVPAAGAPWLPAGSDGAAHSHQRLHRTLAPVSSSCSGLCDPVLAAGSCAALAPASRSGGSPNPLRSSSGSWMAGSKSSPTTTGLLPCEVVACAGNGSSSGSNSRPATGDSSSSSSSEAMAACAAPAPTGLPASGSEPASMASTWLQRCQLQLGSSSSRLDSCQSDAPPGGSADEAAASNLTCRGARPLSGSAVLGLRQRARMAEAEGDATRPAARQEQLSCGRRAATAPERLREA